MHNRLIIFLIIIIAVISCKPTKNKTTNSADNFPLDDLCLIVNKEKDNRTEGAYLVVVKKDSNIVILNYLSELNLTEKELVNNYYLGWGSNIALYDAGVENIASVSKVDFNKNQLTINTVIKGNIETLTKGQRVIFIRKNISGFKKVNPKISTALIDEIYALKDFAGKSIMISKILFDSARKYYVMYVNEADNDTIHIYALTSPDLTTWKAANDGKAIFEAKDFENTTWAGRNFNNKMAQCPLLSDVVYYQNKYWFIMNGYGKNTKRNIGIVVSDNSLAEECKISKTPIFDNKTFDNNSWDAMGCFYGKVIYYGGKFLMYYDGIKNDNTERLGLATSPDMINWTKYVKNPVIDDHCGWRSRKYCSEISHLSTKDNKIYMLLAGSKEFKLGFVHHYITRRMYKDKSGNVDDIQQGLYISADGGYNFEAYSHNPVFINDYTDISENEHMGGTVELISKNDTLFMFYIAKTSHNGQKYLPQIKYKIIRQ